MRTNIETMNLPCVLTREELDSKRDEIARQLEAYEQAEQEKKDTAAHLKTRMDDARSTMSRLATEIRERKENRQVEITRRKVVEEGIEETYRLDTGEVGVRSLTPSERQFELGLEATLVKLPLRDRAETQADQ